VVVERAEITIYVEVDGGGLNVRLVERVDPNAAPRDSLRVTV
jgi:hypothetical protein